MRRTGTIGTLAAALIASLAAPALWAQEVRNGDGTTEPLGEDEVLITRDAAERASSSRLPGQPPSLEEGAGTPQTVIREPRVPSVLAILAHPDDEITIAPVLARIAREGGKVTIAFATSGDVGPGVSGMQPGAELAALREDEARCAAFAMGLPEPRFWQLGDGQLATFAQAPDSAARQLGARIAELIAEVQPRIVMTWGPDGGYGHPDHRMVSSAVTEAIQIMGEDRPELLYPVLPASEEIPDMLTSWAKVHPSLVTDRIRYEFEDLEAMRIATDCYISQFDEEARNALPALLHGDVWQGQVHFRLAFPANR